jgi:ubiquinone/menaquinone biosynthesis C-methylase UbiE
MIPRILEPEAMDTPEEALDYDTMDHGEVNRLFVRDFLAMWNGRGPILDVGTGTARIPIEFCRQSTSGEIVGIDLAGEMLKLGLVNLEREGFAGRVKLERVDAKRMPYASGTFQAIMSNSIVHHIPQPKAMFAELARVAATGATIFVRDLLRPSDEATLGKLVETYAAGANEHQRQLFGESLHAALTLAEVQELVAGVGFDPKQVRQTSDRHWTWVA